MSRAHDRWCQNIWEIWRVQGKCKRGSKKWRNKDAGRGRPADNRPSDRTGQWFWKSLQGVNSPWPVLQIHFYTWLWPFTIRYFFRWLVPFFLDSIGLISGVPSSSYASTTLLRVQPADSNAYPGRETERDPLCPSLPSSSLPFCCGHIMHMSQASLRCMIIIFQARTIQMVLRVFSSNVQPHRIQIWGSTCGSVG